MIAPVRAMPMRSKPYLVYAAIGLGVAVVGVVMWALYDARQAAWQRAGQEADNLSLGLERDVARAVNTLDLSLRAAAQGMRTAGLDALAPDVRQAILFDGAIGSEGVGGVSIADASGKVVYTSAGPEAPQMNVADRAYFQAHRQQDNLGLFITPPLRSRNGAGWTMVLSRRISLANGSFAGVVVGGLRIGYFDGLFRSLKIGPQGTVSLISTAGWLAVHRPYAEADIGQDVTRSEAFRRLPHASSGQFEADDEADRVPRLYSYRQIGSLPLAVVVGLGTQDIYADWVQKSAIIAAVMLVLSLLGVAMAVSLLHEFRQRGEAELAARRSERQHAEALARLDALFQNSTDAMFVARREAGGEFVYESVNPVWEELAGLAAASAIGRGPLSCWPPDLAGAVMAGWRGCAETRRPARFPLSRTTGDRRRDWETFIAPVLDERGQVCRLIGVTREMTERNALEAKLREGQRLEAIGQLTAGIAHDFNNLLLAILGSLEFARERPGLEDNAREALDIADQAARRGATLVHRMLAFARKQDLTPVPLGPLRIMEDVKGLLTNTLGSHVRAVFSVADAIWPVRADGAQLQNCLFNLALNARDAMPDGGTLQMRAENVSVAQDGETGLPAGDYVRFVVTDDGAGMPPEVMARALEPFFTTKPIGKGTGLGLSMVQGFARQSGGDVQLESRKGKGTTVRLWLPRSDDPPPQPAPPPVREAADRGSGRVLVVDDEELVRTTMTMMLSYAGYKPVAAASAQDALALLQAGEDVDLLVTDQSMPGLTGCELIEKVALLRPGLPSMIVTGFDHVSGLDRLDGRVTVLRKPFNRAVFLRQVQALLGAATMAQAGPAA